MEGSTLPGAPMTVDEPTVWVTVGEATAAANCSRRQLNRLVQQGVVARQKQQGVYHYSRPDCEAIAAGDVIPEDEAEQQVPRIVAQCHRTIEHLLAPSRLWCEMVTKENEALRARCEKLEARHAELIDARERLLDASAEREMLLRAADASEKRKAMAIHQLAKLMPLITAKLGNPAAELLGSLDENQLQLLLQTELITEQQKALLRACLPPQPSPELEPSDEPVDPAKQNGVSNVTQR